jgi:2-phospho-L-lactate guanylyltransferase
MTASPRARRPASQELGWTVVVPVKDLAAAKTRLCGDDAARRRLALAFALDTVGAVSRCGAVARILVVTNDDEVAEAMAPLGCEVVGEEAGAGLNAALLRAAAQAAADRKTAAQQPIAALPADLPALRPDDLLAALTAAARHAFAFVADADGVGTTLLAASAGPDVFTPSYGRASAMAHRLAGAFELPGDLPSLRRDVDIADDLQSAVTAGVGPATWAALDALRDASSGRR